MAKRSKTPRTSHDRLFKEFLERFLPDFLQIFFPEEAARLDFSTLTFPRQELSINLPRQLLRITDVLAEVKTYAGEPEVIIVHIELEALRTVVDSSLTEGDKLFLINMVETYLPQQEVFDAREEIMQALQELEQTWMEKLLEKGQQEGRQEGMRTLLLLMLTSKFGPLPQVVVDKLSAIHDMTVFADISQQLLTVATLDEITFPDDQSTNGTHTN